MKRICITASLTALLKTDERERLGRGGQLLHPPGYCTFQSGGSNANLARNRPQRAARAAGPRWPKAIRPRAFRACRVKPIKYFRRTRYDRGDGSFRFPTKNAPARGLRWGATRESEPRGSEKPNRPAPKPAGNRRKVGPEE